MTKSIPDLQEQIRLRAYGLYEQRGREGSELGSELDDWLQAESDVTRQQAKTKDNRPITSASEAIHLPASTVDDFPIRAKT